MTLVLLIIFALLAMKMAMEEKHRAPYRCLKCGASRPDMHSKWCKDELDKK
jgi:hypothetical protein